MCQAIMLAKKLSNRRETTRLTYHVLSQDVKNRPDRTKSYEDGANIRRHVLDLKHG